MKKTAILLTSIVLPLCLQAENISVTVYGTISSDYHEDAYFSPEFAGGESISITFIINDQFTFGATPEGFPPTSVWTDTETSTGLFANVNFTESSGNWLDTFPHNVSMRFSDDWTNGDSFVFSGVQDTSNPYSALTHGMSYNPVSSISVQGRFVTESDLSQIGETISPVSFLEANQGYYTLSGSDESTISILNVPMMNAEQKIYFTATNIAIGTLPESSTYAGLAGLAALGAASFARRRRRTKV